MLDTDIYQNEGSHMLSPQNPLQQIRSILHSPKPLLKSHKLHNNQKLSRFLYFVVLKSLFMCVCMCVCVSDRTDRQGGHHYSNATFSWLSLIPFLARCHSKTECNQFPRANWRAINCAKGCIVASGAPREEGELRAEGEEMAEQQVRHYSIPSQ